MKISPIRQISPLRPIFLAALFRALVSRPGASRRLSTLTEDLTLFHCQRERRRQEGAALRRTLRRVRVGNETHILA